MYIFQKNFEGEFDPFSYYRQQAAKSEIHKNMNKPHNAIGSVEGDGWKNGTPGVDVTATSSKMGDKAYDWANSGVTGNNSAFTQSVISANRQDAGLDPNSRGDVRGTVNVGKSGLGKAREFLNEKYGAKTESVSSGPTKFDEAALRKQFEVQGMKSEQINDAIAQSKASYEAELAAKAIKNQSQATPTATTSDTANSVKNLPNPKGGVVVPKKEIQDVEIIDTTPVEEESLPTISPDQQAKVNRIKKVNSAKAKVKESFGNIKDKAAATWDKWSDSYGEGITGSLGTDAALAAGGLALAGGAYHLLKKRKAKKKAEKEALENRIKK